MYKKSACVCPECFRIPALEEGMIMGSLVSGYGICSPVSGYGICSPLTTGFVP